MLRADELGVYFPERPAFRQQSLLSAYYVSNAVHIRTNENGGCRDVFTGIGGALCIRNVGAKLLQSRALCPHLPVKWGHPVQVSHSLSML